MTIKVQWKENGGWVTHLENGDLEGKPHRVVIIQHPPIQPWTDHATAYKDVTTDEPVYEYFRTIPGEVKSTTLNKGHKKIIAAGIEKAHREDYAIWAALSGEVAMEKIMLMIIYRRSNKEIVGKFSRTSSRVLRRRIQCHRFQGRRSARTNR